MPTKQMEKPRHTLNCLLSVAWYAHSRMGLRLVHLVVQMGTSTECIPILGLEDTHQPAPPPTSTTHIQCLCLRISNVLSSVPMGTRLLGNPELSVALPCQ